MKAAVLLLQRLRRACLTAGTATGAPWWLHLKDPSFNDNLIWKRVPHAPKPTPHAINGPGMRGALVRPELPQTARKRLVQDTLGLPPDGDEQTTQGPDARIGTLLDTSKLPQRMPSGVFS